MPSTRRGLVCALLFVLLATACGSRVPASERQALSAGGSGAESGGSAVDGFDGGSDFASGDTAAAVGGDPVTGSVGRSSASGGGSGRTSGGGSTGAGSAGLPADTGQTGPGVTATEILLGMAYATNGSDVNAAIGAEEASSTDTKKAAELLIADLNNRGGIHGRKVVPVWHEVDALSGRTYEQHGQEMCSTWTEDNDVFAALGAPYETLRQCMAKKNKPLTYTSLSTSSELTFSEYPLYFEPGNLNLSRIARLTVKSLADRNFFAKAKVGVIAFDDPHGHYSVDKAMLPALASRGVDPKTVEVVYVPDPQSPTDVSGLSAAISSAVLRFNTRGISHVMILDTAAVASFLFMQEAESQGYRPRYGLNSQNGNTILADLLRGSGSQGQLNNSLSVGWLPTIDLAEQDDPNDKATPSRQRCLKIMVDGGLTSFTSRNAMGQALLTCEEIWFFEAAAKAAGPTLNARSFLTGVESLRSLRESPITLGNRFGPGRHDGVARAADLVYVPDCTCFRYTTQPYDLDL